MGVKITVGIEEQRWLYFQSGDDNSWEVCRL